MQKRTKSRFCQLNVCEDTAYEIQPTGRINQNPAHMSARTKTHSREEPNWQERITDHQRSTGTIFPKEVGKTPFQFFSKNKKRGFSMLEEYSERFDQLRKNRVEVSYYKYGPARKNYKTGNVQALPSMERCIEKYNSTGNTEYLVDAANYLMFEFMYPQHPKAHFKATDSKDSAGIVGISVKEMEDLKNGQSYCFKSKNI